MILVDTCVWIHYLQGRKEVELLISLLNEDKVLSHPWIIGELMLGNLGNRRQEILEDLSRLPLLPAHDMDDLEEFIHIKRLYGRGLSLVDTQLLYSSLMSGFPLWTFDKNLQREARGLHLAYS